MERKEKFNRFTNVISGLKTLRQEPINVELSRFNNLIVQLKELEKKVYPARLEEAKFAYNKNKSAFRISAFELMEYNFRENSHSNVLQYLLDHKLIGDVAIDILTGIVKLCIEENTDNLIKNIQSKRYKVEREKPTDEKKRIDLFIVDEENHFVIVIENKFFAGIAKRISEVEDVDSISRTQLDDYKKFVDNEYPDYNKLFILLHYDKIEESCEPYFKITYKEIKEVLNSMDSTDNVLNDYKILLQSITKNMKRKNKIELIKTVNSWENKITVAVSLNEIEQIKMLSYEY